MKITKQARHEAKELFRICQVDGVLDEDRVRRVVKAVIERKPRGYLASLSHFQRLVRLDIERRSGLIQSAIPLSEDLKSDITRSLTRLCGEGLTLNFAESAELIGGMRIRVGSDVLDGSIRHRLDALEESF